MNPGVRGDLPLLRKPDHVHRGAYRGVLHERHLSAASSFQIGVSRGRRIASSGRLARVSQRWHITSSQPYPPLRHCAMVGDGCAGPPKPSICSDHSKHSAASASRIALLAASRACCAPTLAPPTRSPKIRCRLRPPIGPFQRCLPGRAILLAMEVRNGRAPPPLLRQHRSGAASGHSGCFESFAGRSSNRSP
jgi:hypothetical protein